MVITCIILFPFYKRKSSPAEIEAQARDMGMIYEDEVKAFPQNEKGEYTK